MSLLAFSYGRQMLRYVQPDERFLYDKNFVLKDTMKVKHCKTRYLGLNHVQKTYSLMTASCRMLSTHVTTNIFSCQKIIQITYYNMICRDY
jgi:hypothetical protein